MNKLGILLAMGSVFVVSFLVSQNTLVIYTGDVSKLLGLGALVMSYFVGRIIKNRVIIN
jgi:hypothetical protein